jgi:hypothetical protein
MSEWQNYLIQHQNVAYAFALGWLLRNPKTIVDIVWSLLKRIPGFSAWVQANSPALHAWLHGAVEEADKQIDETK